MAGSGQRPSQRAPKSQDRTTGVATSRESSRSRSNIVRNPVFSAPASTQGAVQPQQVVSGQNQTQAQSQPTASQSFGGARPKVPMPGSSGASYSGVLQQVPERVPQQQQQQFNVPQGFENQNMNQSGNFQFQQPNQPGVPQFQQANQPGSSQYQHMHHSFVPGNNMMQGFPFSPVSAANMLGMGPMMPYMSNPNPTVMMHTAPIMASSQMNQVNPVTSGLDIQNLFSRFGEFLQQNASSSMQMSQPVSYGIQQSIVPMDVAGQNVSSPQPMAVDGPSSMAQRPSAFVQNQSSSQGQGEARSLSQREYPDLVPRGSREESVVDHENRKRYREPSNEEEHALVQEVEMAPAQPQPRLNSIISRYNKVKYNMRDPVIGQYMTENEVQRGQVRTIMSNFNRGRFYNRNLLIRGENDDVFILLDVSTHQVTTVKKDGSTQVIATDPFLIYTGDEYPEEVYPPYDSMHLAEWSERTSLQRDYIWGRIPELAPRNECRTNCRCPATRFQPRMSSIQPAVCIKNNSPLHLSRLSFMPEGQFGYKLNSTKVFSYRPGTARQKTMGGHFLILPQPFCINLSWPEKTFQPIGSELDETDNLSIYLNSLVIEQNCIQAYKCYESGNESDLKKMAPCLKEPQPGSELHIVSKNYYGIETVSRISLNVHPSRLPYAILMSTLSDSLQPDMIEIEEDYHFEVAVIARNIGTLFGKESKINCALCLPHFVGRKKIGTITKYSRADYVQHFQSEHLSAVCAMSAHNEYCTQQRVYESFILYIVAIGEMIRTNDEEEPSHPFVSTYTGISDHFDSEELRNQRRVDRKGKGVLH